MLGSTTINLYKQQGIRVRNCKQSPKHNGI